MAKPNVESWDPNPVNNLDIDGINIAEGCPAAGLNNAIRELMAQVAVWLAALFAVAADIWAATSAVKAVTPSSLKNSLAFQSLPITASAISPDMAAGLNFTVTLTGNITINNIANLVEGYGGVIEFIQDATGGRTVTKPGSSKYYGPGGFPTVASAPGARTTWAYVVRSSSIVYVWPANNMSAT